MADEFSLTSRFKIPVPADGNTNWLDLLTHWAEVEDVMLTVLSNKDYIITGLEVTSFSASFDFSYSVGSASINGETIDIVSGNGTVEPNQFNWIFVQGGVLKISAYPPTGATYVPVACLQTNGTGTVGHADLRPSPPIVSGVSIAPYQVNPTSNINMKAGKRVFHADSNVGANTVMFGDAQTQTVLNWGNQAAAKDWVEIGVPTLVSSAAKFVVLNCRMATLGAPANGWAVLELKTSLEHRNNDYLVVDYGHGSTKPLNTSQVGAVQQIMLPLVSSTKSFQVRTLVDSLGGSGVYYTSIRIMGYIE